VERAIEIVERVLEQQGSPVYVRKQIVHNTHVVHDLEQRGAIFVDELDEVPDGAPVVFSAHGVAPEVHEQAKQRNLRAIDATCPLVTKVHHEAKRFAADTAMKVATDAVQIFGGAGYMRDFPVERALRGCDDADLAGGWMDFHDQPPRAGIEADIHLHRPPLDLEERAPRHFAGCLHLTHGLPFVPEPRSTTPT